MTEMVERVARTLSPTAWLIYDAMPDLMDDWLKAQRAMSLSNARAAIAAMREPTEADCNAVATALNNSTADNPGADCWNWLVGYKAFIDAALGEDRDG